ncbi:hypothetical protein [Streptomyces sp. NPDC051546]|uniref:P-type ATPase n=1 Tax=Streptomyces sp. NPDC051546 TaxID=3365655 RepID=UPI0037876D49
MIAECLLRKQIGFGDHTDDPARALAFDDRYCRYPLQHHRRRDPGSAPTTRWRPSLRCRPPGARVLREGAPREVPATDVVPGDVLVLGEGDIVAADAQLAEASALLVDECMLTGESVAVDKDPCTALSAGTVVVRGRGVATAAATGAASALDRIAPARSRHPRPCPGRPPHGHPARPRTPPPRRGDPRCRLGPRHVQDRHPHRRPHGGPAGLDAPCHGRPLRRRLRAGRRCPDRRRTPDADGMGAATSTKATRARTKRLSAACANA